MTPILEQHLREQQARAMCLARVRGHLDMLLGWMDKIDDPETLRAELRRAHRLANGGDYDATPVPANAPREPEPMGAA